MIDNRSRFQDKLLFQDLYPSNQADGLCACGCGQNITNNRKKWAEDSCRLWALNQYYIVKGNSTVVRANLFQEDQGQCRNCGKITEDWEADHILPVHKGGGGCDLDNYQTLCKECHKLKTYIKSNPKGLEY